MIKKISKTKLLLFFVPIILFIFLVIAIEAGISVNFETWAYNESIEHMSDFLTNLMKAITKLGDPILVVILCFSLLFFKKTRIKVGLPLSISVIASETLNLILKEIFARQRPTILQLVNESSYSFPSGHAMVNATIYTMFGILILKYIKDKKLKILLLIPCIVMPFLIAFTRVYLGVHYITDVMGGLLLGFLVPIVMLERVKLKNRVKKDKDKNNNEIKKN